MPLKSGYSRQTFSANLAELIRAGHERNNAIMAAASMARKSFFKRFPQGALPNWLAFPKTARTANHYDSGGRPLGAGVRTNPITRSRHSKIDPIGAHAVYESLGRRYLGTVRNVYWDNDGLKRVKVQYFNGEWWPFDPPLSIVKILEREIEKNPRDASPNHAALAKATALYEGFTGKAPRKLRKLDIPPLPQAGVAIGKVFGIMYYVDATNERFHHEFKGKAQPLLVVSPDGHQVFLHGGAFTFTKRGFVDK